MATLKSVTVLAPAKLNLALDVVGLLPNGYHNLDMTMQAITLYERVVLRRSNTLSLSLPGSPVAANDSNTAIKAESRSVGFADRLRRFGRDFQRVDRRTVAPEPEIQVRTCRQPGRAYVADELPLPYARSLGDPFRISFQVQVA